ncbi:MAG: AAA family ATPase [Deltaproteobacteria bacterium]|jgi:predicted ATPase|nr:AAA family ATPase [Deltaproteobacteria bacterium]
MKLRELYIRGFKSIDGDAGQIIPLGDVTVLLGANGSGKSNLLSFFTMLQSLVKQKLKRFVGKQGVSRLLFYGPKATTSISFTAFFNDGADHRYEVLLKRGLPDGLFLSHEKFEFGEFAPATRKSFQATSQQGKNGEQALSECYYLTKGEASESGLAQDERPTSKLICEFLSGIQIYQFDDTSETAKIRDRVYMDDASTLHHDGGNLAAFLKMLASSADYEKYYQRIVRHIQRVMPQFGDFDLESIPGAGDYVRLNWQDSSGNGYLFDPHQISDGSLRFMALATLLLQPPDLLPKFIVLDEPELGLHPAAIAELSGMVKIAAQNTQLLLATQSTRLIDEFSPEELVIVERDEKRNCSAFKQLDAEQLSGWLARYSLSELWEKNVLGGQP